MFLNKPTLLRISLCIAVYLCGVEISIAQNSVAAAHELDLQNLSAFQNPGKTWRVVGGVKADLDKPNTFKVTEGQGILVNLPSRKEKGSDLLLQKEHGDIDLELDYMMAKGSNSGIYLQGLYELQLEDSWGKVTPTAASNGGIYERWDEGRPNGQKGYEGYAPRQNVSKAPGLWQHLKVSFQAPRFDAQGKKISNAKMLRVELNGVTIHENVELRGPTRGALSSEEKATGPLRLQGDHGAVAFRNIKLSTYEKPRPELGDLAYQVYKGKYEREPDYGKLTPEYSGKSEQLSSTVSRFDNDFLIRYTGTLKVKEAGNYTFKTSAQGGYVQIKINNKVAQPFGSWNVSGTAALPAGELPFELLYSKVVGYARPALTIHVAGPGVREYLLTDIDHSVNEVVDPILVDAQVNTMLRSFINLPEGGRVVKAISVGSPQQIHFSYDLDKGTLVQVWRGNFLDATPMWHDRGNGSSKPAGAVLQLSKPALTLSKLPSVQSAWQGDTAGTGYRPRGYVLDGQDRPVFKYQLYGASVSDAIRATEDGHGFTRDITVEGPAEGLYARLAEGAQIEEGANGLFLIDGQSYYLRLLNTSGAKPVVRTINGRKELVVPVRGKLSYSLLF